MNNQDLPTRIRFLLGNLPKEFHMRDQDLPPSIRSLLENTPPLSAEKLEFLRAEEERDKQNFHQEISAFFTALQDCDADTLENRFGFCAEQWQGILAALDGQGVAPEDLWFPADAMDELVGKDTVRFEIYGGLAGETKAYSAYCTLYRGFRLTAKYCPQRSPKLKIVSIVREMRSRSDWRDITIFQAA